MKALPPLRRTTPAPPVKILQFGTGRFLRAFADFFVQRANESGAFEGSIVAVQSTGRERAAALASQGGCYTLWTRDAGGASYAVLDAISQAFSAQDHWEAVLAVARSPDLSLVFSNTTEIGLALDADDDLAGAPPRSYPSKLTAVLLERARHFDFDQARGLVVLPCELIAGNGDLLRSLVEEAARRHGAEPGFLPWLARSTVFCNTLVDRIVPGAPPESEWEAAEARLGYRDAMLITAEAYRLWAIEGNAAIRRRIGFADADPGITVTDDIAPYRLRKIRLLNGGHTLTVTLGLMAGNRTVLDNMSNPLTAPFIESLLRKEIGPILAVDPATVGPYIDEVLDRWRNPYLVHRLIDITLQSTSKMRHRVVPSIAAYYAQFGTVPHRIALGFAAYLCFMRGVREVDGEVQGRWHDAWYPIRDDHAPHLRALWNRHADATRLVPAVCRNTSLWGLDLAAFSGWTDTVTLLLELLMKRGAAAALGHIADCVS